MGAGAARGPMYPTNLADDVVWRPTYSSLSREALAGCEYKGNPVGAMPRWPASAPRLPG